MKRVIPITIISLFIALGAFGQRGPVPTAPPPPPGGPQRALADYLGLTDSQKAAAESIESDFRNAVEPLHEQIVTQREAADAKFMALLTAEQKAKFAAFQAAVEFLRGRGPGGGAHP